MHSSQDNNFTFLRVGAALLVLVSHQYALLGLPEPGVESLQSIGGFGLLIFFSISGYLVAISWERDPNFIRFTLRRLLRIWPGLAVAVVLTMCVVGPLFTNDLHGYIGSDALSYLQNLRFKHTDLLPGVFSQNGLPYVNGSLWTLPIEVRWYAILAILGLVRALRFRMTIPLLTGAMALYYFGWFDVDRAIRLGVERKWKEELGLYFLHGACIAQYREAISRHRVQVFLAAAIAASLFWMNSRLNLACWIVLPPTAILFGSMSWPYLRRFDRFGDISYGLYIYAFPVQQALIAMAYPNTDFYALLIESTMTTTLLAFGSWHIVESKALRFKPRRSLEPCGIGQAKTALDGSR